MSRTQNIQNANLARYPLPFEGRFRHWTINLTLKQPLRSRILVPHIFNFQVRLSFVSDMGSSINYVTALGGRGHRGLFKRLSATQRDEGGGSIKKDPKAWRHLRMTPTQLSIYTKTILYIMRTRSLQMTIQIINDTFLPLFTSSPSRVTFFDNWSSVQICF
jgi:hypothetical protein